MAQLLYAEGPEIELPLGSPTADSTSRVGAEPQRDEALILQYLRSGIQFAATCYYTDIFTGRDIADTIFLTDGKWVWTSALTFYVERYHWRVEAPFVGHMQSGGWRVSNLDEIDLEKVRTLFHSPPESNGS